VAGGSATLVGPGGGAFDRDLNVLRRGDLVVSDDDVRLLTQ
jgi:hypothetical protein